jgi:hypothetical protein
MLDFLRSEGFAFAGVDIRSDGVAFLPANQTASSAYDQYKAKGQDRDRSARSR